MKKITVLSFFAFLFLFPLAVNASFPVKKSVKTNELVTVDTDDSINKEISVTNTPAINSGKSQVVAALLAWLVGIVGVHRFYLGYTWQGIVQILTLGGLGIWTLIDLIRIITGDLQPKSGNYSKTF